MKKSPLPAQDLCQSKKQISGKEALVKILRWHFGHSEFRGKQLEAIESVLSGRDCFCLMPTGGGKSMCYQIPALAKKGIVLVVCPLIALMENQVMELKKKGISAEFLSSTQTSHARVKIFEDLASGKPSLRLLYVTPELIATAGFSLKLLKIHSRGLLHLIAIDEAHCISTWGHDFSCPAPPNLLLLPSTVPENIKRNLVKTDNTTKKGKNGAVIKEGSEITQDVIARIKPSYRKLSSLRNNFPDVPILALTATAVPKVQRDVIESLCLQNPLVLKSSFNRPNIYYEVRYKDLLDNPYADLCSTIKSYGNACAIVYCLERTTCDALAAILSENGVLCAAYHAGLKNKLRSSVLDDWISSKIQVVVATVAFGMGIDRKDVRVVCHFSIPKSMEGFYQESGRAGRDQLASRSLLYYGINDRKKMEFILSNAAEKSQATSQDGPSRSSLADFKLMVDYCEGSGCRRKKILESFGEQASQSLCQKSCDACKHPKLVAKLLEDLTACVIQQKTCLPRVLMNSSSDMPVGEQSSEFWSRDDDELYDSEDDISDSDEALEISDSLYTSVLSKSRISEKIDMLQRAEESYYQNKGSDKEVSKSEKNSVSDTLRDSSKQRLSNALKQTKQRLGSFDIDLESAITLLENECYNKYGKSGKSFYLSQLASTMRWLSSANSVDLMNRLGSSNASSSYDMTAKAGSSSETNTLVEKSSEAITDACENIILDPPPNDEALLIGSQERVLPPTPTSGLLHKRPENHNDLPNPVTLRRNSPNKRSRFQ